jgi:hypothetical protein
MTWRGKKQGSMAGKVRTRLIQDCKYGPTETERIAIVLLEKKSRVPKEPKPVTIRKFSWEEKN